MVSITLCGVTGWFEKIMDRIPLALAAAMLAGVLFQFGVSAFASLESRVGLVAAMFIVYLLGKRFAPRYAVVGVLAVGILSIIFSNHPVTPHSVINTAENRNAPIASPIDTPDSETTSSAAPGVDHAVNTGAR